MILVFVFTIRVCICLMIFFCGLYYCCYIICTQDKKREKKLIYLIFSFILRNYSKKESKSMRNF